ncbi:MAG: enoyl-CoA hydratase/isomerase family protein [Candidatus Riflebacteria bacterium]|nr:enoyl-CoA hydratase/isomerase family protein [Candidatus Riflebacteria bacterium]
MTAEKAFETIIYQQEGPVARVTLNRPVVHNAFNSAMIEELIRIFTSISNDKSVRVVVFGGSGKSFCAGADLNWMREIIKFSYEENLRDSNRVADMMEAINFCRKPVIAKVQGATLGGGTGLAAACDLVIASEAAFFSLSEVKIGLVPACIAPYVIARIGPGKARECFITGERLSALKAVQIGLATEVVSADKLDSRVNERVAEILNNGPEAIAEAKALVASVTGMPIAEAKKHTAEIIARLRISPEGQEGMDAFLSMRKPKWVVAND